MLRCLSGKLPSRIIKCRGYSTEAMAENFELSTLPNGLKVATSNVVGHFSALGMYAGVGTRHEVKNLRGCTNIIDRLAFKSTENMSAVQMAEALERLGGNYQCTSGREYMMYHASVFNRDVEKMLSLMADTVRRPQISEQEVEEQKSAALYDAKGVRHNHEMLLPEMLHEVAYRGEALGVPMATAEEAIRGVSRYHLRDYRNKFYNPQNFVAAFIGVPHEEAVAMASRQFGDMENKYPPHATQPARYIGGMANSLERNNNPSLPEMYHMQIAFESLPIDHPDIYTLATLQTLLGGGGSFSAGGPGKGMYSRLYTNVLNKYHFVDNCMAFHHSYSDSGLFGISISVYPNAARYMAPIIAEELISLLPGGKYKLTEEEVDRAKNQLKSSLLMNLESRLVELEDLGRQILLRGNKIPVAQMISKISEVTPEDCMRVAELVLTGSVENSLSGTGAPTIITQGSESAFGDSLHVLKHYGLGRYDRITQGTGSFGWSA
ncbi:ACR069Cp [Eremothecium gossypii ATCC 10895]|uniref:Alpha-MPP n=1 Tax=Eremothecium gossypii (strain ATCC 10895 / CBS 109.51 / FGSC 9923 / NRRL Y-1056) TaxID=284811 RepID=Q75C48_EREGS|nr:ACR069Cp [Eremothecium gossypii ATCC 10895]AAS51295.1 ACR069Cp [Eremothecium gossypii ATCC 10895]AEY95587.1 FACR069Cp [Eremothecium gossypii FDAG1]